MIKDDIKIIFFGNTDFSKVFLKYLHEVINFNIVGVVTDEDKILRKHKKTITYVTPVKEYALENNIPVLSLDADELQKYDANLYVVVAYKYIPKSIWSMPAFGTINIHPSILPEFRGPAPIEHAIMNGCVYSGITCFYINDKIDTGDILTQIPVKIPEDIDAKKAYSIMADAGTKCLYDALFKIISADGHPEIKKQNPDIQPTYAPKIKNVQIDWNKSGKEIYNLIRALTFYNGAYTYINGIEVRILEVYPEKMVLNKKEITIYKDCVWVGAGDNFALRIIKVKPAGKKEMDAKDFINGIKNKCTTLMITD